MTRHISTVHFNEVKFVCNTCDYKAFGRSMVANHQATVHGKKETYILRIDCKICEEGEVHNKCEDKVKNQYLCRFCSIQVDTKIDWKNHEKVIHNNGIKTEVTQTTNKNIFCCAQCEYEAGKKERILKHINKIHDNEPSAINEDISVKEGPVMKNIGATETNTLTGNH